MEGWPKGSGVLTLAIADCSSIPPNRCFSRRRLAWALTMSSWSVALSIASPYHRYSDSTSPFRRLHAWELKSSLSSRSRSWAAWRRSPSPLGEGGLGVVAESLEGVCILASGLLELVDELVYLVHLTGGEDTLVGLGLGLDGLGDGIHHLRHLLLDGGVGGGAQHTDDEPVVVGAYLVEGDGHVAFAVGVHRLADGVGVELNGLGTDDQLPQPFCVLG